MKWRKHRISLADFMRGNYPPYVPYPCWTKAPPATGIPAPGPSNIVVRTPSPLPAPEREI